MWQTIKSIVALILWIRRWAKEIEKDAETRLSPEQGRLDRARLEQIALTLAKGTGDQWCHKLLRWIGLNDESGEYLATVLKSSILADYQNADGMNTRMAAERRLLSKFTGSHQP